MENVKYLYEKKLDKMSLLALCKNFKVLPAYDAFREVIDGLYAGERNNILGVLSDPVVDKKLLKRELAKSIAIKELGKVDWIEPKSN